MAKTSTKMSNSTVAVIGAAAATAAAAAAGAYWFYGSGSAKMHRKAARSWMLKARADVVDAVEKTVQKVGEIDQATYLSIVENVISRYTKAAGATKTEIARVKEDAKNACKHMTKTTTKKKRKVQV